MCLNLVPARPAARLGLPSRRHAGQRAALSSSASTPSCAPSSVSTPDLDPELNLVLARPAARLALPPRRHAGRRAALVVLGPALAVPAKPLSIRRRARRRASFVTRAPSPPSGAAKVSLPLAFSCTRKKNVFRQPLVVPAKYVRVPCFFSSLKRGIGPRVCTHLPRLSWLLLFVLFGEFAYKPTDHG